MATLWQRWQGTRPLMRAEIIGSAWECFSVVLFVAAVLPAALASPWPGLLFAGGLLLSTALARTLAQRGRRGINVLAAVRLVGWWVGVMPLVSTSDVRMLVATTGFGLMASGIRRTLYRRLLHPTSDNPSPTQMRTDLRAQLGESATVVGIVGGHVMLLFSVAFLRTTSQVVYEAWWDIVPVLAILGTGGFTLMINPVTDRVLIALRAGKEGPRGTLLQGLAQAQAIPRRLAWINFSLWFTCTTFGVFYYLGGPQDRSWPDVVMQVAFGSLFSWGVSFYQRGWHQDAVTPIVRRLRTWTQTEAEHQPGSLQRKMLSDFGLPALFTLTLSLFAAIGLYRSLGSDLPLQEDFNAISALCASFLMLVLAIGGVFERASRVLSQPLVTLSAAADRVASGQLDSAVPRVEGPTEFVALGQSVEDMRKALARTIAELKEERAGLETNVQRRTAELSQALDELKQAQSALIQGERLASIGQLMAGIAHEIYNPLTAIAGSIGSLERVSAELSEMLAAYGEMEAKLPDDERQRLAKLRRELDLEGALSDLEGIHKVVTNATKRSVEIVANLKNFSRAPSSPQPADLNGGMRDTLGLLRHQMRDVEVIDALGDLPPVVCREGEINQVFMNLLTNAVQAIDEQEGQRTIEVASQHEGGWVTFSVSDSGPGVQAALGPRIFEPFVTTKPRGVGTGLGLSISQDIVRRHGGTLALSPGTLGGAQFVCRLPVEPQSARDSSPRQSSPASGAIT